MKHADDEFFGKILLFGEYSIIYGSSAITIPFLTFSGKLKFIRDTSHNTELSRKSNDLIKEYLTYLDQPVIASNQFFPLDLSILKHDIDKGLYFHSNIPDGYGAGSSGALVAALFSAYTVFKQKIRQQTNPAAIKKIRIILAMMESYFHGNSSGLDPLSSLLARPLLIDRSNNVSFIDFASLTFLKYYKLFLIDTLQTRKTKPLVDWFKKQVSENKLNIELLDALNNQIISAVLSRNMSFFDHFLIQLSMFQLENMQPMIPDRLSALWLQGIETGTWTLKLCGSGGGGYFLGFTRKIEGATRVFKEKGFNIISL